ncbi:hypothetical protein EDC32_10336 [Laceyella sacchari]|nr:hypothetical protein EDC32_10336 [Laceyella sacchari]
MAKGQKGVPAVRLFILTDSGEEGTAGNDVEALVEKKIGQGGVFVTTRRKQREIFCFLFTDFFVF